MIMVRDGEEMRDPFGERRGKFQWKALGEKLAMLRENNPQWFVEVKKLRTIFCGTLSFKSNAGRC